MTIQRLAPQLSGFDSFPKRTLSKLHKLNNKVDVHDQALKTRVIKQESGVMRIHHKTSTFFRPEVFSPVDGSKKRVGKKSADFSKIIDIETKNLNLDRELGGQAGVKEPFAIVDKNSSSIKNKKTKDAVSHSHVSSLLSRIDSFHNVSDVTRYFNDIS